MFISLPKLKTHHWAGATLSLKNLFGTLPGICYGWPKNELHWRGIANSIVDIALTQHAGPGHRRRHRRHGGRRPAQRHGQASRRAGHGHRPGGRGRDLLPADEAAGRAHPDLVSAAKKLGRIAAADIPQLGEPIEALAQPFEWPPKLEKQLLPAKDAA